MPIDNAYLTELTEQLENNAVALASLDEQIYNIGNSSFYQIFSNPRQQAKDIAFKKEVKQRVFRMRLRILEKISDATVKEIFFTQEEIKESLKVTA